MQRPRAVERFSKHPWACLVLATLLVVIGVLFPSGWVPTSPNRPYFPGHEWVMAALCLASGAFFAYCAIAGLGKRSAGPER